MPRQLKAIDFKVTKIEDRTVTGIFSVFGNLDQYNDKIYPGAFAKTFQERGDRIVHLWQHDMMSPPIAKVTSLRELNRAELPDAVLSAAPEAMGGAEVTREYYDTPRGNEVLTVIKSGAPLQMSFAYDAVKFDFEELPGAKYEWEKIRNLREVRLYETSDVLWGANDATVAAKGLLPEDFLFKQLLAYLEELKAGRRNAATDQERINTIAKLAIELGADNVKLAEAEDEAAAPAADDPDKTAAGSRAADALTPQAYRNRLELAQRRLAMLQRSAGL